MSTNAKKSEQLTMDSLQVLIAKEAPSLSKKIQSALTGKGEYDFEHLLTDLKKQAPSIYSRLEEYNFKLKVDEKWLKEYKKMAEQSLKHADVVRKEAEKLDRDHSCSSSCKKNGEKGDNRLFYMEFIELLQKEAPALYTKYVTAAEGNGAFSEKKFYEELEKKAPKLYARLKASNFKVQIDEDTKHQWADKLKQAKGIASELQKTLKTEKQHKK